MTKRLSYQSKSHRSSQHAIGKTSNPVQRPSTAHSPADCAISTTINSATAQTWAPSEPPDHQTRMSRFLRLLQLHPYNIHGDIYSSITKSYLLLLTAALMESQSASDTGSLAIVRKHASPDLEMVAESVHKCLFVQTRTLEEHLQNLKVLKSVNPHWRVDPFSFCLDLKEGGREAVVWLTSRGRSGFRGDADVDKDERIPQGRWECPRESVSIVFWRKEVPSWEENGNGEKAIWIMYRHVGIRGPGGGLFPWVASEELSTGEDLAEIVSIGLPGCVVM